ARLAWTISRLPANQLRRYVSTKAPRSSRWTRGSTIWTPAIASDSVTFAIGRSFNVDLAVIADHEPQRPRASLRSGDSRLPSDQRVLKSGDVGDDTVCHDDGVLDLRVRDLTSLPDGGER